MTKAELRKIYQQGADDEIDNIIVLEALEKYLRGAKSPPTQPRAGSPE